MKIDIRSEKMNILMKRKEVMIDILNPEEATPSRASLQSTLAKHFKRENESVEIVKVCTSTGTPKSLVDVFVWDEKKVEDLSKPKEEKTEEAPVEKKEIKEEQKAESTEAKKEVA